MEALTMVTKHLNSNRVRVDLDQLVEYYGQLAVNNFTIDGLGLGPVRGGVDSRPLVFAKRMHRLLRDANASSRHRPY